MDGRIVVDSRAGRKPDLSGVHVDVHRPLPGGGTMAAGFVWPIKDGQLSFNVPAVESTFEVNGVPDGWMVRRITVDGTDTDVRPVTLAAGNVVHVEIVLTDRVTRLFAQVTNKDGEPVAGASVIVFPDGPLPSAIIPSPESRWIRLVRTDRDGHFATTGLAPGLYQAVAVDRLPYFAVEDTRLLQQLASAATQVRVGDGSDQSIVLHPREP